MFTVSIRVNAPPSVKNLTVFSVQDTPIAIPLTGSDPDTSRGDTVSVAIVDRPTHGNVTLDGISSKIRVYATFRLYWRRFVYLSSNG